MRGMKWLAVGLVALSAAFFGGCKSAPKAEALPVEIMLAKDVSSEGRVVQVDLVGVGDGQRPQFVSKSVTEWFKGGDPVRAGARDSGTAKFFSFTPGGATSQAMAANDPVWNKALGQQSTSLYVFAFVSGDSVAGKDDLWRKELPLDPNRYDGERIRLEVGKGGVNVLNLKPEKK